MEFSLLEIIKLFMIRLKIILLCTVLSFLAFYIVSRYFISPTYIASVQMYVDQTNISGNADLNQLTYAQKVVTTYINFLQTKQFYNKVVQESDLNYSPVQLKKMTLIQDVNNTEIFQINVSSKSAKDSYELVKVMQKVAPELISTIKSSAKISVVDPVTFPDRASGPKVLLNTLVGGILGFLLSVIAIFLWEIINVKVKNQEDLKKRYDVPILGCVPNYKITENKLISLLDRVPYINKFGRFLKIRKSMKEESKFIVHEAFNTLRTNLRFTLRGEGCKKIIVNSPLPSDGKSTVCTNLAISLAQSGAKVLLIDCDLRKGIIHELLYLKSTPGISDILSGMTNEKDAIQYSKLDNLQVLSMGALPPNPTELLSSIQMEDLIKRLEKFYDYILIDSPPVNIVSDALSLSKLADGIVMVVREGVTTHPNIASALNKYNFSQSNVLGFVLNATTPNQGGGSKSQYHYYKKYSH